MIRSHISMDLLRLALLAACAQALTAQGPASPPATVVKTERFDRDPGWDAHNNRIVAQEYPTIVQDFGYSETAIAGKGPGEMGGQVWRASEPAFYGDKIGPRTLDEPLSA